nr:MAG TPA_asm: hypothetical protein [Caudoviricetes sp.]
MVLMSAIILYSRGWLGFTFVILSLLVLKPTIELPH